jgi:transcriptional regulator with XRE-family HTH domain
VIVLKINEKLKVLLSNQGWSQKRLAEMTGLTNVVINYYEHGAKTPTIETVRKIAEALGVEPEKLTGEKLTDQKAVKRLFSVFREFGGQMSINDGKIAVSFRKLDLTAFYDRYQEYMQAEAAAEEEKDP